VLCGRTGKLQLYCTGNQYTCDESSALCMTCHMASIIKKIIRGRPYYYLRECQRVDGKPKIVRQKYLGTAASMAERLQAAPSPQTVAVAEFGAVAACLDMARRLGVAEIVDQHVPRRSDRGPSVGQYILLAALNRCVEPTSKSAMASWYGRTALPRLLPMTPGQLSAQRFWDQMDRIPETAIAAIERDLARRAVREFGLDLRCVLFDATNFFSFVDSFNKRSALPQRGHSKEGRASLRIVGLALAVTADSEVPLLHNCYAGNQHDATTFSSVIDQLATRCRELAEGSDDVTLVFDKGNNSEENLDAVETHKLHFVGSLVPTQHQDLLDLPRRKLLALDKQQYPDVRALRVTRTVFGVERTVLVTWNRKLYTAQLRTLQREVGKRRRALEQLEQSVARHRRGKARGRAPTLAGTQRRVDALLAGRHMRELFDVHVRTDKRGVQLGWSFRARAWTTLRNTLLGRTILFTSRNDWTNEQIVHAYRSQHHVETAFRRMKDPHTLSFRPTFHWTDQKLRVHALYCVIALTILSLLRRSLRKAGHEFSIRTMIETLAGIREAHVLYDEGSRQPASATVLTTLDDRQKACFDALGLERLRTA